jgi:hypothetical protein
MNFMTMLVSLAMEKRGTTAGDEVSFNENVRLCGCAALPTHISAPGRTSPHKSGQSPDSSHLHS